MVIYNDIDHKGCNIFFGKKISKRHSIVNIFNVNTVTSVGYQMLPVFVYNLFCSIYLTPSLRK